MLQLSATRCSCIAILCVSLVSFATTTLWNVTSTTKGERIFRYRLSPETFGHTLVLLERGKNCDLLLDKPHPLRHRELLKTKKRTVILTTTKILSWDLEGLNAKKYWMTDSVTKWLLTPTPLWSPSAICWVLFLCMCFGILHPSVFVSRCPILSYGNGKDLSNGSKLKVKLSLCFNWAIELAGSSICSHQC
jgi:hypothetical protein